MPWLSLAAIAVGAVLGAWARWALGLAFNPLLPTLPLGTLAANLIGGFIIGVMMSVADPLNFSPATRLAITTGFLGALTTFSTFSAESLTLLMRAQYGWALTALLAHLGGSLLLTGAGILLGRLLIARLA
ncbi:MAG TPA: fluoride efflux transporter CrcB [Steroidobacteraceae bacterium]|nr:fluoride efflux transporter CrcB [Steroidobacteraceae bacterium]